MWDSIVLDGGREVGEVIVLSERAVELFFSERISVTWVDRTISEADVGPKGATRLVLSIEPLVVLGLLLLVIKSWAIVSGEVSDGTHLGLEVAS